MQSKQNKQYTQTASGGNMRRVWTLEDYIQHRFKGNKSAFARAFGLCKQNVAILIAKQVIVIDDQLYREVARHGQHADGIKGGKAPGVMPAKKTQAEGE